MAKLCRCKHKLEMHRDGGGMCMGAECHCNLYTTMPLPPVAATHMVHVEPLVEAVESVTPVVPILSVAEEAAEHMHRPTVAVQKPTGKVRPTLVVPAFILGLARVMEHGLTKNERRPNDWQRLSHAEVMQHYREALSRHTLEALADPYAMDKGSDESVLLHVAANAMIMWWHAKFTR